MLNFMFLISAITSRQEEQTYTRTPLDFLCEDILPKNRTGIPDADLIELGFALGEPLDEEFISAELPPGWSKGIGRTAHWYVILDDKGRARCEVFYNPDPIKYRASMNMLRRYTYATEPLGGWGSPEYINGFGPGTELMFMIYDAGKPIFTSEKMRVGDNDMDVTAVSGILREAAKSWLNEHFPRYRSYMAYWND